MRRFVVTGSIALLLVALLAATGSADPPRAQLRGFICQPALDPGNRAISITAVMRPVAGTERMSMRFELLRRRHPRARAKAVAGHKLGSWIRPTDPTLGQLPGDVWVEHHPVVGLSGAATYHFKVWFRWSDARGRVIRTDTRTTRGCDQPEKRPDLKVLDVQVTPLSSGQDRYRVRIHNAGKTAAGAFNVSLSIGSTPNLIVAQPAPVSPLPSHQTAVVTFDAAACTPGQPVTVVADPDLAVDDANRANNTLAVPCPA